MRLGCVAALFNRTPATALSQALTGSGERVRVEPFAEAVNGYVYWSPNTEYRIPNTEH